MRKFSLTLNLILAAFLAVGEQADVVKCDTNEGWACSVWDQDQNCLGCSKITYIRHEKIQVD